MVEFSAPITSYFTLFCIHEWEMPIFSGLLKRTSQEKRCWPGDPFYWSITCIIDCQPHSANSYRWLWIIYHWYFWWGTPKDFTVLQTLTIGVIFHWVRIVQATWLSTSHNLIHITIIYLHEGSSYVGAETAAGRFLSSLYVMQHFL